MSGSKVRHVLEAIFTVLIFALQNIVYGGYSISIMFIPLFAYIASLTTAYPNLERDVNILFFSKEFIVGRVIALIGFVIFFIAGVQLLKGYIRRSGLVKTGLYSIVRHPQYTGIIIIALGLTVMVQTLSRNPQTVFMWFVQVLGCAFLAWYEEQCLKKKFRGEYQRYKVNVPFMYPIKCPSKIPEIAFTIFLTLIVAFLLLIFPYDIIRFH